MKIPVFRTDSIVTCNSKLLRISTCTQQETGIDFNLPFNVRAGKENTSKPYSISWRYVATGNRLANPQLGEYIIELLVRSPCTFNNERNPAPPYILYIICIEYMKPYEQLANS